MLCCESATTLVANGGEDQVFFFRMSLIKHPHVIGHKCTSSQYKNSRICRRDDESHQVSP